MSAYGTEILDSAAIALLCYGNLVCLYFVKLSLFSFTALISLISSD